MGNSLKRSKTYQPLDSSKIPTAYAYKCPYNNVINNPDNPDNQKIQDNQENQENQELKKNKEFIQKLIEKLSSENSYLHRDLIYKLIIELNQLNKIENNNKPKKNIIIRNSSILILIQKLENFLKNNKINNLHKDYLEEFLSILYQFSYIYNISEENLKKFNMYYDDICDNYGKPSSILPQKIIKIMKIHLNNHKII